MPLLHPPLSFSLQESSALHYFMVFKGTTEADSLHPSLLSMPSLGKVKQIVGSTLRDLKGEDGSALVTNFESDETAAEFANLHKEDGLMGGADDLSKSIAIEELFKELCFAEDIPDLLAQLGKFANKIFPLLNLLRGFKKSRGLAGWRWYQCKQCFELRRGRSQPCYCYFRDANQSVHLVASEGLEAHLPIADMVGLSAEVEYGGLVDRLSSRKFVENAPEDVVRGVREKAVQNYGSAEIP